MRNRILCAVALAIVAAGVPQAVNAADYTVDSAHTNVTFHVRHLFTKVVGRFDRFSGKISFDPAKPEATKVEGSVDVTSINTNNEKRDKHLRAPDFFDAEKFPTITFSSTKVSDVSKTAGKLHGTLTIHGVAKPVVLDVEFLGEGSDPWGNKKAGFSAKTTINRKDFGLNWNETLETGGVLVGEEVEIEIAAEADVS